MKLKDLVKVFDNGIVVDIRDQNDFPFECHVLDKNDLMISNRLLECDVHRIEIKGTDFVKIYMVGSRY